MDEEKNENIPYDPDINHIVDTTIWEEESYGFEEEEHDHEELVSSLTALGTGVLAFGRNSGRSGSCFSNNRRYLRRCRRYFRQLALIAKICITVSYQAE